MRFSLSEDSVVMGSASSFDLEVGFLLDVIDFEESAFDFVGGEHLVFGDLLAAAHGN